MIKKSLVILSISAAYFANAQDVSTIRNSAEIYSNSTVHGSSKYNAMAGSMGALGGDFSVLNSNPAGIGVSVASEFSATLAIENSKNTTSFGGNSLDYKINKTDFGNSGGIAVFQIGSATPWKFVNVGVNYSTRSIDDYSETAGNSGVVFNYPDLVDSDNNPYSADLAFAGHAYNRYGNMSKMSIGVGGNYDNRIYVGAGLNFHNVNLDQYDTAAFNITETQGTAVNTYSETADKQYSPFSESSNGFSASVGVIGKVSPQFRLGAALETPTWWNIERAYNEYENPTDGFYAENRTFSSPFKATLSAAFVPGKNFAINVDYSLGLSKPKYKVQGYAETELNDLFNDQYKSLSEVKVGAEYRIDAFRLRAGYGFTSSPFDSMTISQLGNAGTVANAAYNDLFVGKRNTIGAGIGYDFRSFYIDAAYQNVTSEYNSPFLNGSSAANTGYFSPSYAVFSDGALVSNVKNKRDNFFVTLGWKF